MAQSPKHPAAEHHHEAAGHHHAAAHHHHQAEHHHAMGEHEEAKQHAQAAREHSDLAHKHTETRTRIPTSDARRADGMHFHDLRLRRQQHFIDVSSHVRCPRNSPLRARQDRRGCLNPMVCRCGRDGIGRSWTRAPRRKSAEGRNGSPLSRAVQPDGGADGAITHKNGPRCIQAAAGPCFAFAKRSVLIHNILRHRERFTPTAA